MRDVLGLGAPEGQNRLQFLFSWPCQADELEARSLPMREELRVGSDSIISFDLRAERWESKHKRGLLRCFVLSSLPLVV